MVTSRTRQVIGLLGPPMLVLMVATGCSTECEPGECEPCVGDTCEAVCVDPDDEDVGYACLWECLDGANCDLSCADVGCNLYCEDSTCACEDCNAHCVDGADCMVGGSYVGEVGCRGATCDVDAGSGAMACAEGSACTMACSEAQRGEWPLRCRMSCEGSSTCALRCDDDAECVLCCDEGSACELDCPAGGTTCEGGVATCGQLACEDAARLCPAYSPDFNQPGDWL
jgi:hypothetical protein